MQESERMKRLLQISQEDEIYKVWENSYNIYSEKFKKFTKWCPKRVRSFLYGYAESGRLMYQRMVNIACMQMEFPEKDKK